ncbi:DddA-like double-stranded DNA deaminase toxin [Lentzea sp. NBRC 102530]
MRQGGVDRVELVINFEVCNGIFSCKKLLAHILLPGQTLIIHDPVRSFEIRGKESR